MSAGFRVKLVVVFIFFLLIAGPGFAGAITLLAQEKDVHIDADWRITSLYTYEFRIFQTEDILQIQRMCHHLAEQPDRVKLIRAEIRLPDGRRLGWDAAETSSLPPKTEIDLSFEISSTFPGFSELFADYMLIDQDTPLKHAAYRIEFPRKMEFAWLVFHGNAVYQSRESSDSFSWSADGLNRSHLMVSTATTWNQVAGRYQDHFQTRMGGGLPTDRVPRELLTVDQNRPASEKIKAVMDFLSRRIAYQHRPHPSHALLPDDPLTVLHRGWGDCKDVALLGTALLQAMDIEAFVVLSGKPRMHFPADPIPDPFIFDHALIAIADNGKISYHDYTGSEECASPDHQRFFLHLEVFANAGN